MMRESLSLERVPELLAPGQRVFLGGASNEPEGLLTAVAAEPDAARGVTFVQFPLAALNRRDPSAFADGARLETFFMAPQLEAGLAAERVAFLPMQLRAIYDHLSRTSIDLAFIQVGRDAAGVLRLGPNVDFLSAVLGSARCVVAELNHGFLPPAGCPAIEEDQVDYLVETDRPLPELPAPEPDDASRSIARTVSSLVRDGDCLQTGIGAIPAAVLAALDEKNDLGLHSGLIDDGGMTLIEKGVINGTRKTRDRGIHTTGMALGSRELYDWLAEREDVEFRSANYTHEVSVIREIRGFVSINSAVEVDLFGQVNAEYTRGRQLSGPGGSVDFMRAARSAPEGRSIIAMTATARGGTVSRVVPKVELVTALRTDVDLVVTEYGVADLRSAPVHARAEAMVGIAAPNFRDELRGQWERLGRDSGG
jgi:4-hydroxybutyrate CoA-transferase